MTARADSAPVPIRWHTDCSINPLGMIQTSAPKRADSSSSSPFWSLVERAESVRVRELSGDPTPAPDTGEAPVDGERIFVVRVTPKVPPGANDTPDEHFERNHVLASADTLAHAREYSLARTCYKLLLRENPGNIQALRGVGLCSLELGETGPARRCFEALLSATRYDEYHYWLGVTRAREGRDREALTHFQTVADSGRLAPEIRFLFFKEYGNCNVRIGRLDEAQLCYDEALRMREDSDVLFVNLATLELHRGRPDTALTYLERALQLNPANPRVHAGLGLAALTEGRTGDAESHFLRALDLDPTNLVALHHCLVIANQTGHFERARNRLERCLEAQPRSPDLRYTLAAVLYKQARIEDSAVQLRLVLEQAPAHLKARELLVHAEKARREEATRDPQRPDWKSPPTASAAAAV